MTNIET